MTLHATLWAPFALAAASLAVVVWSVRTVRYSRRSWLDDAAVAHVGVTLDSPPLRDLLPPAAMDTGPLPTLGGRHRSNLQAPPNRHTPRHLALDPRDPHRAAIRSVTREFAVIVRQEFGAQVVGRGPVEHVADWAAAT